MTNLKDQAAQMHARLDKVATNEQMLIQALSDALGKADQRLLDDVRSVTIEHETRRVLILSEIQELAARIGAFPTPEEHAPMIEEEALDLDVALDLPFFEADETLRNGAPIDTTPTGAPPMGAAPMGAPPMGSAPKDEEPVERGADWRKAAKNITEELGFSFNGSGPLS